MKNVQKFLVGLACLLAVCFCTPHAAAEPLIVCAPNVSGTGSVNFLGIGDLAGGEVASYATAVSDNGFVVGASQTDDGWRAFRWSQPTGMVRLDLGEGVGGETAAHAISADGGTVAGAAGGTFIPGPIGPNPLRAVSWPNGGSGANYLEPSLYDDNLAAATGVSNDGGFIVGFSNSHLFSETEAFLWTPSEGYRGLGDPGGDVRFSNAYGVSDDGAEIVGAAKTPAGARACRWSEITGLVLLDDSSLGWSVAENVSPDGSTIVGRYSHDPYHEHAFCWTKAEGMVQLEGLQERTIAVAASNGGNLIVGNSSPFPALIPLPGEPPLDFVPVVWDSYRQLHRLDEFLEANGLDFTGWTLTRVFDISSDGTVIVGEGINPDGNQEAFMAVIPEPFTVTLLAIGAASLLGHKRGFCEQPVKNRFSKDRS